MPRYKPEKPEDGGVRSEPSLRSYDGKNPHPYAHEAQGIRNHGGGAQNGFHNGGLAERQVGKPLDWGDADPMGDDYSPIQSTDGRIPDSSNERLDGVGPGRSSQRPQYPRLCRRTITLAGLPENVILKDITDVVRGGLLLDVFHRTTEHIALVSFLREEDATRFYDHARKNDIYIKNKRVGYLETSIASSD